MCLLKSVAKEQGILWQKNKGFCGKVTRDFTLQKSRAALPSEVKVSNCISGKEKKAMSHHPELNQQPYKHFFPCNLCQQPT